MLPNFDEPVVLKSTKCTVEDFCNSIHKTLIEGFKVAIVWGRSVRHRMSLQVDSSLISNTQLITRLSGHLEGMRVGLSHVLADEVS